MTIQQNNCAGLSAKCTINLKKLLTCVFDDGNMSPLIGNSAGGLNLGKSNEKTIDERSKLEQLFKSGLRFTMASGLSQINWGRLLIAASILQYNLGE
jgi:hypothetical protein